MNIMKATIHSMVMKYINQLGGVSTILDMGGIGRLKKFTTLPVTDANIKSGINATSLPYEDNSFDVACSIAVLEHVSDHKKFIQESIRVSKNGVVHWLPMGNAAQKVEDFKKRYGHIHPCVLPKKEMIESFGTLTIKNFITCESHLLFISTLTPSIINPELFDLIDEIGFYSYGCLIYGENN